MLMISKIAIAGGTVALAAAAGVYMQSGEPPAALGTQVLLTTTPEMALPVDAETPDTFGAAPVKLGQIALTSADFPAAVPAQSDFPETPTLAATSTDDLMAEPKPQLSEPVGKDACVLDLSGETRAAAMVALHLSAPCQPNEKVVIDHGELSFTVATDEKGKVDIDVPVLSEDAVFIATMSDGNAAAVEVTVDTLVLYDRAVVQWFGAAGIAIHAREFGADYDSEGHVWAGAPRSAAMAARGEGGFVTRLGDPDIADARLADVYTFPTGTAKAAGDIELTVEVAVTEGNCGREVSAEVVEVLQGAASEVSTLEMTLPACDAVGDYLLLKNLVDDLKIASR